MNIYMKLNKIIEYVENNLDKKIEVCKVSKMIGMNEYTFQKIFSLLSDVPFSEYIRNRRLSNAGQELFLNKEKIIDIAFKYQYNSATAFSRAFEKFHGIKPSKARKNPEQLKMYTKLHFNEKYEGNQSIEYKIIQKDEIILYGTYIFTDNEKIKEDAPLFYRENAKKYEKPPYGMIEYKDRERFFVDKYWILYNDKKEGCKEKIIPRAKWIQIIIKSQDEKDIQNTSKIFYKEFLPNSKYNFKDLPELEYYHDDITEFLIPIED